MHVRRWMAAGLMLGVLVLARVGGARAEAGRPRIGLGMLVNLGDAPMAIGGAATLRLPVGPLTVGVEADQILLSGSGPTPADATSGSMTRAAVLAGLTLVHLPLIGILHVDLDLEFALGHQAVHVSDANRFERNDRSVELVANFRLHGRRHEATVYMNLRWLDPGPAPPCAECRYRGDDPSWMLGMGLAFSPYKY